MESKTRIKTEKDKYTEATGRRKTAVARVRLFKGDEGVEINGKSIASYFTLKRDQDTALAPLAVLNLVKEFRSTIKVSGGGIHAQAGAVRHGIARAISIAEPDFKKRLRQAGFLTRDSRMVERKKYGLRKARRAPQWAKR